MLSKTDVVVTRPKETICPGCKLWMPVSVTANNQSYYNNSAECWSLYTELLCEEYSNAFLAGHIHQMTVDAYAVQHAGGNHPDKSVDIHLFGLYLTLVRGFKSPDVPAQLQHIGAAFKVWPRFPPPIERGALTICDIALCDTVLDRIKTTREWAWSVWNSWSQYHAEISQIASNCLRLEGSERKEMRR